MKIVDLIKMIVGCENILLIKKRGVDIPKKKLSIYGMPNGICFYEDATVGNLKILDGNKEKFSKIKEYLANNGIDISDNKYGDKYLAITEILRARNKFYNKSKISEINIDEVKKYVDKLNDFIYKSLDFKQISSMKNLIDIIKDDEQYRELYFVVDVTYSRKKDKYVGRIKKTENYSFGNKYYCEKLDVVNIYIYDDFVELLYQKNPRKVERELNANESLSVEDRIIIALDAWKCYWLN